MMMKVIEKISAHLRQRMHEQVIAAAPWYVGDPCYIIPDDDWGEFCDLTFSEENKKRGDRHEGGHVDSVIDWHGQEITIWSNGGDGTWTFNGLQSANGATAFDVDAGIFCVINLNDLPAHQAKINDGILFEHEPELEVEDGVVYIQPRASNGRLLSRIHDDHHMECDNYQCGAVIRTHESISCGNGCCEGCDNCGVGWECEEE